MFSILKFNKLYAFDKGIVLFKPTKAKDEQFRFTKEKALSYFIAGKKKVCKEDSGFAIHPWKKITFNNASYIIENNIAIVMGNYHFTDLSDITLKVDAISKNFGQLTAVNNLSFEVRKGEIVGFLGPNGAGKSTTMKMLTSFYTPDSCTLTVNGTDTQ